MSSTVPTAAGLDTPSTPLRPAAVRADVSVPVETGTGTVTARMLSFTGLVDGREHIALVFGERQRDIPLVRVHSECLTGDVFGSGRCDCGPQLREALDLLARHGGVLLYLRQEGRGIGLYNKLDAYLLQDGGLDTFEANRKLNFADDLRDYRPAAQMLAALSVDAIQLLTNNPDKARQLTDSGVEVRSTRSTGAFVRSTNRGYLLAKREVAGHRIELPDPERT
ncbi:GTP cyclohydrolase II [Streptomyces bacillaris]|uniref:GTP cyclohydrolase II n=1 Tax=Streptomyces TaxID=1883 RepID=UPI00114F2AC6|nr:GTP cyclohydrolase II [Streptomyces cavourensis]TQO30035.1 GTP cyclohydrolase II [Streptomyces cavourensis]GGU73764.1 GTP cyclohydrolase-2 [Streptomyces cavourensis]